MEVVAGEAGEMERELPFLGGSICGVVEKYKD